MPNQRKVTDAKQDRSGNISHVKIEGNTNWTPLNKAIDMAQAGKLDNVHVSTTASGREYLRTNPDSKTTNNLDEMAQA